MPSYDPYEELADLMTNLTGRPVSRQEARQAALRGPFRTRGGGPSNESLVEALYAWLQRCPPKTQQVHAWR